MGLGLLSISSCSDLEPEFKDIVTADNYFENDAAFGKQDQQLFSDGSALSCPICQKGGEKHEEHHDDILENEDSQHNLPVGRIKLGFLLVKPKNNGRTAERHEKADE